MPNDENTSGQDLDLDDLTPQEGNGENAALNENANEEEVHASSELEAVFDVPVNVQAVLGRAHLEVSQLLKLAPGAVIELDRKIGEAIDIYVNNRLVARGEVVLVDEHVGVTMTEIIKGPRR
ncbi:MAG: flagellar motor switch protein FliN [Pseudomonadota bacterium]